MPSRDIFTKLSIKLRISENCSTIQENPVGSPEKVTNTEIAGNISYPTPFAPATGFAVSSALNSTWRRRIVFGQLQNSYKRVNGRIKYMATQSNSQDQKESDQRFLTEYLRSVCAEDLLPFSMYNIKPNGEK